MIWIVAKNELRRVFYSPFAWIVFSIALFILGLLLLILLNNFYTEIQAKLVALKRPPGLTDIVITPYLFWVALVGILIIPLFAVRSVTEERNRGANLLLSSAPISITHIVLGKYVALSIVTLLFTSIGACYALLLGFYTSIDYGKTIVACLGVFLFINSFNAAALYIANLTRTPVLASAGIIGFLLILGMLHMSGSATASSSELFLYLANFPHFADLLTGSINTVHVTYFILFALFFLILCVRTIKQRHAL